MPFSYSFQSKNIFQKITTRLINILNDNLFKTTLITLIAVRITQQTEEPSNIVAGLLILPFFLFSARAGQLAKKYNRTRLTKSLKLTELCLMIAAGAVFFTQSIGLVILLPILFGTLSAFFGPIRYALLPEQLEPNDLIAGNAYIEKTTYFSIIFGLILGIFLPIRIASLFLIVFSIISYLTTRSFPSDSANDDLTDKPILPKENLNTNFFKGFWSTLKLVGRFPLIFRSILGATWFWSIGLLIILQIYPLTAQMFYTDPAIIAFFLIVYALGVGVGTIFCNRLLRGVVHTTYVPIGTIGMAFCFFMLFSLTKGYVAPDEIHTVTDFLLQIHVIAITVTLFFLAFFCGLYVVPLNALIQSKAPKAKLAIVFAANNIINALGIAMMALIFVGLRYIGFDVPDLFLFASIFSVVVSVYNCTILPDALVRSLAQAVLEFFYRVTVKGLPNFQAAGKRVLIISNHTSLLDGLLIAAFMPEKITFTIKPEWENKWFAKFFGLMVDLYPLDLNNPLSLRTLVELIKKNKKVMIFPEHRVSVTGALMKVYEGAGLVAEKANADILPIRINGAQYSKLSLLKKKYKTQLFPKITMNILPPKKFDINPNWTGRQRSQEVSKQLYDMMVEMMYETSKLNENLFTSLLNAKKIHGKNHYIAEDINRKPMKYKTLLLKSYVLGQAMDRRFPDEEVIGLMMPNVLANLVAFFAMQSVDKAPAMLNFSSGIAQVLSCIKTTRIKTVLTSKKFIENAHLEKLEEALIEEGVNLVYLEDFANELILRDKLRGVFFNMISKKPNKKGDGTAAVLFTSGSEGMPKAVFLSHRNFQANRYQAVSVLALTSADVSLNALPMFHAFGLGVGTLLMVLTGIKTFLYPSPLHYRIIPELAYEINATIMCGTDTFFAGYAQMAHPYDFFALRYAIVGAEKLKEVTAELWMKKLGVRILEGYGATECSPVISLNTPMNVRAGSVGRLLPGMTAKLEKVPGIKDGQKLIVSGYNVMQGYMKPDNPGVLQPPKDGWHDTGDIVKIDEDGFVFIQGRAKRFAKIGGEMVSLTAIEQLLSKLYPMAVQGVVAIPDPKKGEQLVLITTQEGATVSDIKTFIREQKFSDLGAPAKIIHVKEPPVLGSGKFDYQLAQRIAEEQAAG